MEGVRFQTGDVVYLKSGSPKMTVVLPIANTSVRCVWVVFGTGELMSADLPHAALKLAEMKRTYARYDDGGDAYDTHVENYQGGHNNG